MSPLVVLSTGPAAALCTNGIATSRHAHRTWRPAQWRPSAPRRLPPPRAGLFGGLFGSGESSSGSNAGEEAFLEDEEGGKMVALDASSAGSLDGSSEEAFGPLVGAAGQALHAVPRAAGA